jgi:hypothetical protein
MDAPYFIRAPEQKFPGCHEDTTVSRDGCLGKLDSIKATRKNLPYRFLANDMMRRRVGNKLCNQMRDIQKFIDRSITPRGLCGSYPDATVAVLSSVTRCPICRMVANKITPML